LTRPRATESERWLELRHACLGLSQERRELLLCVLLLDMGLDVEDVEAILRRVQDALSRAAEKAPERL
jgi:hypothetical protein